MTDHSAKDSREDPTSGVRPEQLAAAAAGEAISAPPPEDTASHADAEETRSGYAEAPGEAAAEGTYSGPAVRRRPRPSGN
ncbi:hypothetical protein [Streptomyces sp. NPDC057702]|uniref:hypothetical protein n=1 Tax=unclassified Streptomyces TaxID=2593676 RepID=UPI0036C3F1BB